MRRTVGTTPAVWIDLSWDKFLLILPAELLYRVGLTGRVRFSGPRYFCRLGVTGPLKRTLRNPAPPVPPAQSSPASRGEEHHDDAPDGQQRVAHGVRDGVTEGGDAAPAGGVLDRPQRGGRRPPAGARA